MPTVQGTSNFPSFNVPADFDVVNGTPTAVSSPLYQNRLNTMQIVAAGGSAQGVEKNLTGTPTRGWMGIALRRDASPSSGLLAGELHNSGAGARAQIRWTAAGELHANLQGETTTANNFATSAGSWYWVEMIYLCAAGTYLLDWQVNGSTQTAAQRTGGAGTTLDFVDAGCDAGDTGLTFFVGGYWAWGTATSQSDWLGEPSGAQPSDDPPIGFLGRGAGW